MTSYSAEQSSTIVLISSFVFVNNLEPLLTRILGTILVNKLDVLDHGFSKRNNYLGFYYVVVDKLMSSHCNCGLHGKGDDIAGIWV